MVANWYYVRLLRQTVPGSNPASLTMIHGYASGSYVIIYVGKKEISAKRGKNGNFLVFITLKTKQKLGKKVFVLANRNAVPQQNEAA